MTPVNSTKNPCKIRANYRASSNQKASPKNRPFRVYAEAVRLREVLSSKGLMNHELLVTDVSDRRAWLASQCDGRSVLHVGCCDVPIFDPETNLHIFLAKHSKRLDGLDISAEGISVLRQHVAGDYFMSPAEVTRDYDLVLVPEVLEHTGNPQEFLTGIFSIPARTILITAPHIQWFERTRREGRVYHEEVHGDHRAWYSPYTLLNTLLPFIDAEQDDLEIYLLQSTGSVALRITTPYVPKDTATVTEEPGMSVEETLRVARERSQSDQIGKALLLLAQARDRTVDARLVHFELELLLKLGRNMDALRLGVEWMRSYPQDPRCLELCADAFMGLGDPEQAQALRDRARALREAP